MSSPFDDNLVVPFRLAVADVDIFLSFVVFFFNDTATTEIYTLSLHDALPICLIHVAPGREEDINDVAGGESEQDKDDDRHAEQRQHGDAEAAGDIPAHGSLRPRRPGAGRAYRSNQTSCMRLQL